MKLSSIKIDAARIEAGDWVGDIPEMPGVAFRVRGFGNADYRRFLAKRQQQIPRADRAAGLAPEATDAIMAEAIVETILLDWRGLEDDAGKPLPYSKAKAAEIFANRDFRPLLDAVSWAAGRVADTRAAEAEADSKN